MNCAKDHETRFLETTILTSKQQFTRMYLCFENRFGTVLCSRSLALINFGATALIECDLP